MRLELEDIIGEIITRMDEDKKLRNRVLLKNALNNLSEYKRANDKPL